MQRAIGIGCKLPHQLADRVGSGSIVRIAADIRQHLAIAITQHVNVIAVESHPADEREVAEKACEASLTRMQQRQLGVACAFAGGNEVDLAGNERRLALLAEVKQGLGHHLRGKPSDHQQYPAGIAFRNQEVVRHGEDDGRVARKTRLCRNAHEITATASLPWQTCPPEQAARSGRTSEIRDRQLYDQ